MLETRGEKWSRLDVLIQFLMMAWQGCCENSAEQRDGLLLSGGKGMYFSLQADVLP